MNDKELLKAAARAAGIVFRHDVDDFCTATKWERCGLNDTELPARYWNPLTDDGDALRLAVKMKMDLKQWESNSIAVVVWDKHATEDATKDRYAATRRAIVRAAAALDSGHNTIVSGLPLEKG